MAPNPQQTPTPTTTVPAQKSIADQIKEILAQAQNGGFSSLPAGSVSPSSRSAIGVQGTQTLDPLTGKPTGYFGFQTKETLPQLGGFEPAGQTVANQPKYFSGDEDAINSYSKETIAQLQYNLSKNGLMGRKYTPGIVDNQTRSGFKELLGISNRQGTDWVNALGSVSQAGVSTGTKLPAYQLTNPEDLKAVFRKAAQDSLGRNLQDGDINRLVETYQAQEAQYQKQVSTVGGVVTQAPSAQAFAQSAINKDFGTEVNTRKLSDIFGAIDANLSKGK
jgi:hypothetical protein